jgi:hypothetical protein
MICMGYAKLSSVHVVKVRALEDELKVTLLAYEKPVYSALKEADLKRIRDLEGELGLALVAYEV